MVPRRRVKWARPTVRADAWALAFLVLAPLAVNGALFASGRTLLPGDDLTQNYPLRVYAGEVIRSGHLPGFDPYLWSGTPLLAGWNAGAMFPGTWLFAFLSGGLAWALNLAIVGILMGAGSYLLLRQLACGPAAALLGALVATYTGFMSGQIPHVGLVEGAACLPLLLLGIDALALSLAPPRGRRARTPWCSPLAAIVLLGVAGALTVLAGDPRAVSSAAIVAAIYALACLARARSGRRRLAGALVGGAVLAATCSAAQWLPGITFLRASQRGVSPYSFFAGGSLGLSEIAGLLATPFGLGGNGNLGQPVYFGDYNLPEVTIGVGLVALVAAFALLPEALSGLGRRRPAAGRELGVFYVMLVAGVLLTLGGNTPLGTILQKIPLYGGERLQNRNAEILDFALAVLLASFLDALARRSGSHEGPFPDPLAARGARFLACVPAVFVAALSTCGLVAPDAFENFVGVLQASPALLEGVRPYLIVTLVLAVALTAVLALWPWRRLAGRAGLGVIAAFTALDVATYVANASYALTPASMLASSTPLSAVLSSLVGPSGRFAIYNPAYVATAGDAAALESLGVTDLNILRRLNTVQGYGSIVEGTYQNATNTHEFEALDEPGLAGTTFDVLNLAMLVTLPAYLEVPLAKGSAIPVAGGPAVSASGRPAPVVDQPPELATTTGPWSIATGASQTWLLAATQTIVRVTVVANGKRPPSSLNVGIETLAGARVERRVALRRGVAELKLRSARPAERIFVENPNRSPVSVGAVVAVTRRPNERLLLDGALQGYLEPPHWLVDGTIGPFTLISNTEAHGPAWLQAPASRGPDDSFDPNGSVLTGITAATGAQTMHVVATKPVTLVRSMTYSPGWTARIRPDGGGPTTAVRVRPFGLVQAISMPKGAYTVSWQYAPRALVIGFVASCVGSAVVLALLALCIARARNPKFSPHPRTLKSG